MNNNTICIIPARGGSKTIPAKNLVSVGGRPLLDWTILQAVKAEGIDRTFVTTDNQLIGDRALALGAEVIWRPKEISGDKAQIETAMLHVLDSLGAELTPKLVVLLQPTSPLRRPAEIDFALEHFERQKLDSMFSASAIFPYVWRGVGEDHVERVKDSYVDIRATRQDRVPLLLEDGAVYITKTNILRKTCNRLGGKIGYYIRKPYQSIEIDRPEDIKVVSFLMREGIDV